MNEKKTSLTGKLRNYVDGEADTFFEYFMLVIVFINTISLGLETSPEIMSKYAHVLFILDQICLTLFIIELLIKFIAYNKDFFGEKRKDKNGETFFHINTLTVTSC